jgi:hypothetical protein
MNDPSLVPMLERNIGDSKSRCRALQDHNALWDASPSTHPGRTSCIARRPRSGRLHDAHKFEIFFRRDRSQYAPWLVPADAPPPVEFRSWSGGRS